MLSAAVRWLRYVHSRPQGRRTNMSSSNLQLHNINKLTRNRSSHVQTQQYRRTESRTAYLQHLTPPTQTWPSSAETSRHHLEVALGAYFRQHSGSAVSMGRLRTRKTPQWNWHPRQSVSGPKTAQKLVFGSVKATAGGSSLKQPEKQVMGAWQWWEVHGCSGRSGGERRGL